MNFFDDFIKAVEALLGDIPHKSYAYNENSLWSDAGRNEVILQRDTAFELSGVGFNLVTSAPIEDGIYIYGDALDSICESRKFARISVIGIDDTNDEQKAYDLIRKIEFTKYHIFPKGYMMRTASKSHKEAVRVSKAALAEGITFERVGNLFLNGYKKIGAVKGAKIIFVTSTECDYKSIEQIAEKSHAVTETLNHIMNNVSFDCSTCNLKPICDEVEGMRELHFKNAKMN